MVMPARVAFASELVTTPSSPTTEREPPPASGAGALADGSVGSDAAAALAVGDGAAGALAVAGPLLSAAFGGAALGGGGGDGAQAPDASRRALKTKRRINER
jgi:hypothetical protein